MYHTNNHYELISNITPFFYTTNLLHHPSNKLNIKNRSFNDNHDIFFFNKNISSNYIDNLTYCLYLIINDYSIDNSQQYYNHKSFQKYLTLKENSIKLVKQDNGSLLKFYKIYTLNAFINDIFSTKIITWKLFYAIAIYNDILILVIKDNIAYYFGKHDSNNIDGFIIADNYLYFTKKYHYNSNNFYKVLYPFKHINSISTYKISDLQNIANQLNIIITIDGKNRLKKDIYNDINNKLAFDLKL